MMRLMMRHNRHDFKVLRKAAEYLAKAMERYHIHRLSMSNIFWFFAPLALTASLLYGDRYPFQFDDLFWAGSPIGKILVVSIPFFIFSFSMNLLLAFAIEHDISHKIVACEVYKINLRMNARAGIMEEVVYRFLLLVLFIPVMDWANYVLGGFREDQQGALSWIYTSFLGSLADSYTWGVLSTEFLEGPFTLGLAIIIANMMFAKGHIYQGWIGLLHSWYIGFGFFYLTFNHGLIVAMVVHAMHNNLISTIKYFDMHWDTRHIKDWKHLRPSRRRR